MAQLTIQPNNTAELAFADKSFFLDLPSLTQNSCFWIIVLPDFAGDTAIELWQALWRHVN